MQYLEVEHIVCILGQIIEHVQQDLRFIRPVQSMLSELVNITEEYGPAGC